MTGAPKNKRHQKRAGITLLEVVVALGIFLVLVTSIVGIFSISLLSERRALTSQSIIDNTRVAMEVMSRAIRQAKPNTLDNSTCGSNCLDFVHINPTKGAVSYTLNSISNAIEENGSAITSSNVYVESLEFYIFGGSASDSEQPRVTITVSVRQATGFVSPTIDLQTTVSLRTLQE